MSAMAADDSSESGGAESVQLTHTRLAHYRETLCAVKPLQSSSSNTALVLTRGQHIELLNVSIHLRDIVLGRRNGSFRRSYVLLVFLFFFQRGFFELSRPIAVKLCHVTGSMLCFIIEVSNFGCLS